MKLYQLLHKLSCINTKLTSTEINTNVVDVEENLEGDWKGWCVNIRTKEDDEYVKKANDEVKKKLIDDACYLLELNLCDFPCDRDEKFTKAEFIDSFRKMIERGIYHPA